MKKPLKVSRWRFKKPSRSRFKRYMDDSCWDNWNNPYKKSFHRNAKRILGG